MIRNSAERSSPPAGSCGDHFPRRCAAGTYPYAANTDGSPFHAKPGTPTVNGLYNQLTASRQPTGPLLTNNPNGANANPVRLGHNTPMTCDQDHGYTAEQVAADHGAEDAYPTNTGNDVTLTQCLSGFDYPASTPEAPPAGEGSNKAVMSYYDAIRSPGCGTTRSTSR